MKRKLEFQRRKSNIAHMAKIAYSDGETHISDAVLKAGFHRASDAPAQPSGGQADSPDPDNGSPDNTPPDPTTSPVVTAGLPAATTMTRARKLYLILGIVSVGLMMRAATAFPELTTRQISTKQCRSVCSFLFNHAIAVVLGSDSGFVECLRDSLWPDNPPWFPWCLRGVLWYHVVSYWYSGNFLWPRQDLL